MMEESEQPVPPLSSQDSLLQVQKLKTETADVEYPTATASSDSDVHKETLIPQLLRKLNGDLNASDLLISLLVSALKSYKRDSVLRPFPPMCCSPTSEGAVNKNFEKLECIADVIPRFDTSHQQCEPSKWLAGSPDVIQLLTWVLDTRTFTVKSVDKNTFSQIKQLTGQTVDTACPTHVFQIDASPEVNFRFENERKGRDLIYAYHGSRIENFHSILHNGLCNHLNRNSLYGEGTYLSSELNVCMPYSQTGQGWSKSRIGDRLSCVAVCEIISDSKVRCHTRRNRKTRVGNEPGGSQDIPEKYYIVQNDELIRVRYLLIYAEKTATNQVSVVSNNPGQRLTNWLSQHRLIILMISYVVVLLAIGLGSSSSNKLKSFKKYLNW